MDMYRFSDGPRNPRPSDKSPLIQRRPAAPQDTDWLHGLGLEQYTAIFRDNDIDAAILPRLTAEDLRELGVVSVGHRRSLLG
jgi:SAM domain (Sterile alpha motif)